MNASDPSKSRIDDSIPAVLRRRYKEYRAEGYNDESLRCLNRGADLIDQLTADNAKQAGEIAELRRRVEEAREILIDATAGAAMYNSGIVWKWNDRRAAWLNAAPAMQVSERNLAASKPVDPVLKQRYESQRAAPCYGCNSTPCCCDEILKQAESKPGSDGGVA